MKEELLDEILDAIIPALESSEAQTAALFQVLRQKNVITAEEHARILEQAANAADIKSRAARLRLKRVLSSALHELEKPTPPESEKRVDQKEISKQVEGPEPTAQAEQQKYQKQGAPESEATSKHTEAPGSSPEAQTIEQNRSGEKKQDSATDSGDTVRSLSGKKAS